MALIGNQNALAYTSFAKQDFTVTATTSYTLDHSVSNENEIALFINFVRQEPTTSYSCDGNQLTLTEATSVGDDMYCVFIGKAVQTVTPASSTITNDMLAETITVANGGTGLTSGFKNGITMAQQWRLTSDVTANTDPLTNWEVADDPSAGSIGTSMSLNNGIFTFPQTGIYKIDFGVFFQIGVEDVMTTVIDFTKDNGSSYDTILQVQEETSSRNGYGSVLVDVTDTSNDKVKFVLSSVNSGNYIRGDTDKNETYAIFTRLGDT